MTIRHDLGPCLCRDLQHRSPDNQVLECGRRTDRQTCQQCHDNCNVDEAPTANPGCPSRDFHHLNTWCGVCNGYG